MALHALRTAVFTAKGLKRFMKDGYEHHAKSFDARCGAAAPHAWAAMFCARRACGARAAR